MVHVGQTVSVSGLLVFGTTTSLLAKIGATNAPRKVDGVDAADGVIITAGA